MMELSLVPPILDKDGTDLSSWFGIETDVQGLDKKPPHHFGLVLEKMPHLVDIKGMSPPLPLA